MDAAEPAIAELVWHRVPDELEPLTIEPRASPVRTALPDHHRRIVGQRTETPFARLELGIRVLPRQRARKDVGDQLQAADDFLGPLAPLAHRGKAYQANDPAGHRERQSNPRLRAVITQGLAFNRVRYFLRVAERRTFPVQDLRERPRKHVPGRHDHRCRRLVPGH